MSANYWYSGFCSTLLEARDSTTSENVGGDGVDGLKQLVIHLHIHDMISIIAEKCHINQPQLLATAIVFVKRFYLKYSSQAYDPRLVAPTSLLLASKVDECPLLSISVLKKAVNMFDPRNPYRSHDYISCEFLLLRALSFDLIVYHPYRFCLQFLLDCGREQELSNFCFSILNDTYRMEGLCLLVPPYLIAIASIYMACQYHKIDSRDWLCKLQVSTEEVCEVVNKILHFYNVISSSSFESTRTKVLKQWLITQNRTPLQLLSKSKGLK